MEIPSSWNELTIKQFTRALAVEGTEYEYQVEKQIAWIAAITGADEKELEQMNLTDVAAIANKLQWVKQPIFEEKVSKFFYLNGKLYEVCNDISKIRADQMIDLCSFMKDNPMLNVHKLMATVCIPRKWLLIHGKYDGARHQQISNMFFEHLTMDKVYPIALFFCRVCNAFLQTILISLENEKDRLITEAIIDLQKYGSDSRINMVGSTT